MWSKSLSGPITSATGHGKLRCYWSLYYYDPGGLLSVDEI